MIFLVIAALTFIAGLNLFAYLSGQVRLARVANESVLTHSCVGTLRYSLNELFHGRAHSMPVHCSHVVHILFAARLEASEVDTRSARRMRRVSGSVDVGPD